MAFKANAAQTLSDEDIRKYLTNIGGNYNQIQTDANSKGWDDATMQRFLDYVKTNNLGTISGNNPMNITAQSLMDQGMNPTLANMYSSAETRLPGQQFDQSTYDRMIKATPEQQTSAAKTYTGFKNYSDLGSSIENWMKANPNATIADIQAASQTYGLSYDPTTGTFTRGTTKYAPTNAQNLVFDYNYENAPKASMDWNSRGEYFANKINTSPYKSRIDSLASLFTQDMLKDSSVQRYFENLQNAANFTTANPYSDQARDMQTFYNRLTPTTGVLQAFNPGMTQQEAQSLINMSRNADGVNWEWVANNKFDKNALLAAISKEYGGYKVNPYQDRQGFYTNSGELLRTFSNLSDIAAYGYNNPNVTNYNMSGYTSWDLDPSFVAKSKQNAQNNAANYYATQQPQQQQVTNTPNWGNVTNTNTNTTNTWPNTNLNTNTTNTYNPTNTTTNQQTQQAGLGDLYPRINWGNYQTSNRGGRYFDATSGNYQGLINLNQQQPQQTIL